MWVQPFRLRYFGTFVYVGSFFPRPRLPLRSSLPIARCMHIRETNIFVADLVGAVFRFMPRSSFVPIRTHV